MDFHDIHVGCVDFNLLKGHFLFVSLQVKKNYEALRQREEEERMVQSSPPRGGEEPQSFSKWEKESHETTRELLKVKDRLIEVERNVSDRDVRRSYTQLGFSHV